MKNDELALNLLKTIESKKAALSAAEKPKWKTSCTIGFNPAVVTDRINIQTVRDTEKLVEIYGFLLQKEAWHSLACKELGVKMDFIYMGYTKEEWLHDILTRINQISFTQKKNELDQLEKTLNGLVSLEKRQELELRAIQERLEKGEL